jgi:hypothetical protein
MPVEAQNFFFFCFFLNFLEINSLLFRKFVICFYLIGIPEYFNDIRS